MKKRNLPKNSLNDFVEFGILKRTLTGIMSPNKLNSVEGILWGYKVAC